VPFGIEGLSIFISLKIFTKLQCELLIKNDNFINRTIRTVVICINRENVAQIRIKLLYASCSEKKEILYLRSDFQKLNKYLNDNYQRKGKRINR
jgi:hypothetical protein